MLIEIKTIQTDSVNMINNPMKISADVFIQRLNRDIVAPIINTETKQSINGEMNKQFSIKLFRVDYQYKIC